MEEKEMKEVNKILLEQLERLNKTEVDDSEIKRSNAICGVSKQLISIAKTNIDIMKLAEKYGYSPEEMKALAISDE